MIITAAFLSVALLIGNSRSQDVDVPHVEVPVPIASVPAVKNLPDLQDFFDAVCRKPNITDPCAEKGGADVAPNSCDLLRTALTGIPLRSYFYDPLRQQCVGYIFEGCVPGSNHFPSIAECQAACVHVCRQAAPMPTELSGEKCEPDRRVWYYHEGEGRCIQTLWNGCKVTNNVFESELECMQTCMLEAGGNVPDPVSSPPKELAAFCREVEPTAVTTPPSSSIILTTSSVAPLSTKSTTEPPTIAPRAGTSAEEVPTTTEVARSATVPATTSQESTHALCEELTCARQSTRIISRLNFVSVFARKDCFEVVVRLRCRKGITRRPSDSDLDRLCGLVRSGIEHYWSRPSGISVRCPNEKRVSVRVRVQLVSHWLGVNAKDVVVKVYNSEPIIGNTRSHNSDILPMTVKYNEEEAVNNSIAYDELFSLASAHEFGNTILRAARGFRYSWTHKGTSTWYGKRINTSPAPASGEIDLMKYYASYPTDRLSRTFATEEDVLALVAEGKRSYCTNKACAGNLLFPLGHSCFRGNECQSGRCQFFRCVQCTSNEHCQPNYYCAYQLQFWKPNRCRPAKQNGSFCLNDRECASGHCHGARCGECENDNHCPAGQFCAGKNLPIFQANRCQSPKSIGAFCTSDRGCTSGHCHTGRCGECETDSHCPSGQYCAGKNFGPFQVNACEDRKSNGAVCTRDHECVSSHCHGLRCGECEQDSHCPPSKYCGGKNFGFFQANTCKERKSDGKVCTRDRQCASSRCHGLRCGECEKDIHCPVGEYCAGQAVGPLQSNRCERSKSDGNICVRDRQCLSGRCHLGKCGGCNSDDQCFTLQYCSGLNIPFTTNRCQHRKATGSACTRNHQCVSGRCHTFTCVECSADSHCFAGQYCSKKPLGNGRCTNQKCSGFCLRDRQCRTNNCKWYRRCQSC